MTITVTVDREDLPQSLLPIVKSHMRVDGAFDDGYIRTLIARAIGRLESTNDVAICPTTVTWTPDSSEFVSNAAELPVHPVLSFTAVAGSPAADVSSSYSIALKWGGLQGVPIQQLLGTSATGLVLTLKAGFTDETLPPEVLDRILRLSAHLYENRGIVVDSDKVSPDMALDATWWMPKV